MQLKPPTVSPNGAGMVKVCGDVTGFAGTTLTETCTPPGAPSNPIGIAGNYEQFFQTVPGVTYEFAVSGFDPNSNPIVLQNAVTTYPN